MKQKYLINAKENEKGIAGQARNDRPFRMKIIKYIFSIKTAILSLVLALSACSDYLDIMPDNVATMEHAFSNREVTKRFLHTCYSYMPNPVSLSSNPALVGGDENWWCLDPITQGLQYWNRSTGYLAMGRQNANDPYLNSWDGNRDGSKLFVALRDCNIFLENIHLPTDIEVEERAQWAAEVKFLKAYYHFYLLQYYGPIPIIRENIPVNAVEGVRMYREPIDDVINYIVELIDEAIPDLMPNATDTRMEDAGRITQSIAVSLKAKTLVWAASPLLNGSEQEPPTFSLTDNRGIQLFPQEYDPSKWTRAAQAIQAAIDISHENGHHLYAYMVVNSSAALSDITKLKCTLRGAVTEKFNPEIVWPDVHDPGNLEYYVSPYFDIFTANTYFSEFGPTLKIAEEFYSRNGLPLDEDAEWINWVGGNYIYRYDTLVISKDSGSGINEISSLSDDHKYYVKEGEITSKLHCYREPRFYAWIGFDRGIWELNGKNENERYLRARNGEPQGTNGTGRHSLCGYNAKKLVNLETVQTSTGSLTQVRYTYPVIRLTDLYLLYAEALNESQGPGAQVYQWVDSVRLRAGIPGVVEAYSTSAIAGKKNKPATKEGLRDIIKRERMIELSFESQRFYDLLRWKDALQYWNEPVKGWKITERDPRLYYQVMTYFNERTFNTRDYFWPLKLSTLQVNSNFVQNPGW
jgi:hypothetical protein